MSFFSVGLGGFNVALELFFSIQEIEKNRTLNDVFKAIVLWISLFLTIIKRNMKILFRPILTPLSTEIYVEILI